MTPDDSADAQPARAPDAVREGDYLVVRKRGAKLPPGCVVCNMPEAKRVPLTARKFNLPVNGLLLMLLSTILLFMYLVAPVAQFEAGLCSAHVDELRRLRRPRLKLLLIPPAIFALGVAICLCGPTAEIVGGIIAGVSFVLLPFAILLCFSPRPLLRAHYSDRRYLWVAGVSPDFLQQLPEIGGTS